MENLEGMSSHDTDGLLAFHPDPPRGRRTRIYGVDFIYTGLVYPGWWSEARRDFFEATRAAVRDWERGGGESAGVENCVGQAGRCGAACYDGPPLVKTQ